MRELFGQVETFVLEGADEFGFLTKSIREGDFKKLAIAFDAVPQKEGREGIRQMIRVEFA